MSQMTIKIGDSFAVPIQFYDKDTSEGYVIPDNAFLTAKIINSSKQIIAEPIVTIDLDQINNAGFILLEVASLITQSWKAGSAQLDIKLELNGQIRHSQTIHFLIEASIT